MSTKLDRASKLIDLIIAREKEQNNIDLTKKDLAVKLGYPASGSHINEVYGKRTFFRKEALEKLKEMKVNVSWLYTGEGNPFVDGYKKYYNNASEVSEDISDYDVNHNTGNFMPVVIDNNEREYITYVPVPAQAGFAREYPANKGYIERLPHFNIPNYHNGRAVAFTVEGDSMTPTLRPSNIVIAEPVDKLEWIDPKEIHVVIADRGTIIKRFIYHKDSKNQNDGYLEWISDNEFYNTLPKTQRTIPVDEVRHVFKVVMKIGRDLPAPDETLKLLKQILSEIQKNNKTIDLS